jgi:hypothetical protein
MRLYINGKNTRTITLYTEAQIVADTGADVELQAPYAAGTRKTRILPRNYVVEDALAGIEFVSAMESK